MGKSVKGNVTRLSYVESLYSAQDTGAPNRIKRPPSFSVATRPKKHLLGHRFFAFNRPLSTRCNVLILKERLNGRSFNNMGIYTHDKAVIIWSTQKTTK